MRALPLYVLLLLSTACGGGGGGGIESTPAPQVPEPPTDQLASNGWPVSHAPASYAGTGYAGGDQMPDLVGTDQAGNTDVSLTQFYGAMVVLSVHAPWDPLSAQGAMEMAALRQALEDESSEYRVYHVTGLIGSDLHGSGQSVADASDWASHYGLVGPVLIGDPFANLPRQFGVFSVPTYVILDPLFQIRYVVGGWPGAMGLADEVRRAWTAFRAENPTWDSPFVVN